MASNSKRFVVYSVKAMKNDSAVWVRAGSAWVNRDGSINVYLDVLPLDGKLHLREWDPATDGKTKPEAEKETEKEAATA